MQRRARLSVTATTPRRVATVTSQLALSVVLATLGLVALARPALAAPTTTHQPAIEALVNGGTPTVAAGAGVDRTLGLGAGMTPLRGSGSTPRTTPPGRALPETGVSDALLPAALGAVILILLGGLALAPASWRRSRHQ